MTILQNIDWGSLVSPEIVIDLLRVVAYVLLGLLGLRVIVIVVRRILRRRTTAQVTMLVTKAISYLGIALIASLALLELGVNLTPILGAAGIVGLAVGIASQASLSNMISGLFLVSEKPFAVGDVIRTAETVGVVESIDLLSVKIRTFDNLFIRVPNEKLANSQLTNITRYPIRRLDIKFDVPFHVDLKALFDLLLEVARDNPDCLQEPAPLVVPDQMLEHGTRILFGVWFAKADFLKVKSELYASVLARLSEAGISPAMPRREIHATAGEAFSVEIGSANRTTRSPGRRGRRSRSSARRRARRA